MILDIGQEWEIFFCSDLRVLMELNDFSIYLGDKSLGHSNFSHAEDWNKKIG